MTREEAIRRLKIFVGDNETMPGWQGRIAAFINAALSSPWKSVKDELPEDRNHNVVEVFVMADGTPQKAYYSQALKKFNDMPESWSWHYSLEFSPKVTHWMYIPDVN